MCGTDGTEFGCEVDQQGTCGSRDRRARAKISHPNAEAMISRLVKVVQRETPPLLDSKIEDLTVRRGSSEANRLKSGAGNCRFTPLAKIQLWEVTLKAERIEKAPNPNVRRGEKKGSIGSIANSQAVLARNP